MATDPSLIPGWKAAFKNLEVFIEDPEQSHPELQYVTLIEMVEHKQEFSSPEVLKRIEKVCEAESKEKDMQLGTSKLLVLDAFTKLDEWFNEYLIETLLDNDEEAKLRYPTYYDDIEEKKED